MKSLFLIIFATVIEFSSYAGALQEFSTLAAFNKSLSSYHGRVYFIGHDEQSQIKDIDQTLKIVESLVSILNLRYGREQWVAMFGGETYDSQKPTVAHIMKYLHDKHHVRVVAATNDILNETTVDPFVHSVIYMPTETVSRGFTGASALGPTAAFLGPGNKTTEVVAIGGNSVGADEFSYAHAIDIRTIYIKTEVRYQVDGKYGPIDRLWIDSDYKFKALAVLNILDLLKKPMEILSHAEFDGLPYAKVFPLAATTSTDVQAWIDWALSSAPPSDKEKPSGIALVKQKTVTALTNRLDLIAPSGKGKHLLTDEASIGHVRDQISEIFENIGIRREEVYQSEQHPRFNGLYLFDLLLEAYQHSDVAVFRAPLDFVSSQMRSEPSESARNDLYQVLHFYFDRYGPIMGPDYLRSLVQRASPPANCVTQLAGG